MSSKSDQRRGSEGGRWFQLTRWSLVVAAGDTQSPEQLNALNELCRTYRPAVLSYIRRTGCAAEEAEDITQDFFLRLHEKKVLAAVNRDKGRFRSFLLASLRNFLANHRAKETAQKRGGRATTIALDAKSSVTHEPDVAAPDASPDEEWDRAWAEAAIQKAWTALARDYANRNESRLFDTLRDYVADSRDLPSYAQVAVQLGKTEDAIKMAVKRMRERFGDKLRAVIQDSIAEAGDSEQELRHLIEVMSKR